MREQAVIHPRRIFNREGTGSAKAPRKIHRGHLRKMKEAAMAEEADGAEDSEGRLRSTCEGAEDHGQPRQVVSTGFFFLFL